MSHSQEEDRNERFKRSDELLRQYEVLGRAVKNNPKNARAWINLGRILEGVGRNVVATEVFREGLRANPTHSELLGWLARRYLLDQRLDECLRVCDYARSLRPFESQALSFMMLALWAKGDREAVNDLVDINRLVDSSQIELPPDLTQWLLEQKSLKFSPSERATSEGWHSGDLTGGPISSLAETVRGKLERYWSTHSIDPDHLFLADRPKDFELSFWTVILPRGGVQLLHTHPRAWMSGVVYVKVPDEVLQEQKPGWLEVGGAPTELLGDVELPEIVSFRPSPGRLLIFPSYFFHRTTPFQSRDLRVSVAFDVSVNESTRSLAQRKKRLLLHHRFTL